MTTLSEIIIDTNEGSQLLNKIKSFKIDVNDFGEVHEDEIMKILNHQNDKSKHQKIKKFGYTWWCKIEEEISKLQRNNKITCVHFEYIDRGVQDWDKFVELLKGKYKNLKNISLSQNFGGTCSTDCDLIILNHMEIYDFHRSNVIFMKRFFSDIEYDDNEYYVTVTKYDEQYIMYISIDKPNIL
jgi:hypothetical protein